MNIGAWISRRHQRLSDPCDEWQGVTVAPHVRLAVLYARLGDETQAVERTRREIAELEGK